MRFNASEGSLEFALGNAEGPLVHLLLDASIALSDHSLGCRSDSAVDVVEPHVNLHLGAILLHTREKMPLCKYTRNGETVADHHSILQLQNGEAPRHALTESLGVFFVNLDSSELVLTLDQLAYEFD